MIKFKQKINHDPNNGFWGDCQRTCIACLLHIEPEKIPHFFDKNDEKGFEKLKEWLNKKDLKYFAMPLQAEKVEHALIWTKEYLPDYYYLLIGTSKSNCNHVVICKNDKIVHDPSKTNSGIIGPADDGFFWIEFLFKKYDTFSTSN